MRDVVDPRVATPDAALALQVARMQRLGTGSDGSGDDRADRLRRREQVLHGLEVARRRRQARRAATRFA